MFSGRKKVVFESNKSKEEVARIILEHLESLGKVDLQPNGRFTIHNHGMNSGLSDTNINGLIKDEGEGRYTLTCSYESTFNVGGWLLFVFLFLCSVVGGFLLFLVPHNAKDKLDRVVGSALRNIRKEARTELPPGKSSNVQSLLDLLG